MTSVSKTRQTIQYPIRTVERAERAMRCAPLRLKLFAAMVHQSVSLQAIAGYSGVQNQYTDHALSELTAENELLWLIQVGLLRREVDGQGLTDSFRLTPLGRQLVQNWQNGDTTPSVPVFRDRFYNSLNRWLRLPF
ncbi:MAG: Npun_F0494 family protein [Kovacikia sp.]